MIVRPQVTEDQKSAFETQAALMLFEARYLQKLLSGEQPQGDQLRQECRQSAKALMADAGTRAECRAFLGMVEGQVKAVRIQLRSLKRRKKR